MKTFRAPMAFGFACLLMLAAGERNLLLSYQESLTVESSDKNQKAEDQKKEDKKKTEQQVVLHNEIVVTATRSERPLATVPTPVSLIDRHDILEQAPNTLSELLPQLPGTSIVGVGANQSRPVIRGLRGQRILMLTDGIRLSNSRRSQSFGEIPSLIDVAFLDKVEVIRGPASVLYGSEAIGGVINMISRTPDYSSSGTSVYGQFGYKYGSVDSQNKGFAQINGHWGKLGFQLNGTYRGAGDYLAPAGSYGNITLDQETPVNDTGVTDNSLNMFLGYRIADLNDISIKYENYSAQDSGFGYVDPEIYDPGAPLIRLTYPDQRMRKFSLKYENRGLRSSVVDGLTLTGYVMNNSRTFDSEIGLSFSPGAGMTIRSSNFTDISTIGSRLEFTKVLWRSHIFTYGADIYRDDSKNTDYSSTEMYGFGPPRISEDSNPNIPNAILRSFGMFVQDDITLSRRASVILGARYQNVRAKTQETPGWEGENVDSTDSTVVAAANLMYGLTDNLNVVIALGRGFRSPNLPERFFEGTTPDGGGYQIGNPDLNAETSLNIDAGLRYFTDRFYVEATYFRNMIYDGIQIQPTGNSVGRLLEYQNVNVEELRLQGFETLARMRFDLGLTLSANFSYLSSKNLTNPELLFADTYGSRLNLSARYTFPRNLFWVEYLIRHNWDQKGVNLGDNPIGDIIPGFTIHTARGGVTLFGNSPFPQTIGIIVHNLTDTLYSELTNASFFRPAPKRHIVLTWSARF